MPTCGSISATACSRSDSSSSTRIRAGWPSVLKNSAFSWYSGALTSAASPARICASFPSGAPPLAVLSCRHHARWRPEGVYVLDRHQQAIRFHQLVENLLQDVFGVERVRHTPANEVAQPGLLPLDHLRDRSEERRVGK